MTALHWSQLKWMARSPRHYKYYLENPLEPTPAMNIGSIAHSLLLGGPKQYVVYPGKVRRGAKWEEFRAAQPVGTEIVSRAEYDTGRDVAIAVAADREAAALLKKGKHEVPLRWKIGDRDCEGRADILSTAFLTELKVTNDASPDRFHWHARKMMWPQQMAWYRDGVIPKPLTVSIIAAEPKPPWMVQVYDLTENALWYGQRCYNLLLNQLRVCEDNDHWPGYREGIALLDVPDDEAFTVVVDEEEITVE
jgi:hypothetical protein